MLIALLVFVWLLIWVITLFEVIRRPDLTTGAKVAWALVILLIPVVGVAVYLVARPPEHERIHMGSAVSAEDQFRAKHPS